MEFKDYYAVLGVAPDADDKTIKTAYRKLARQYHPDVSKHADAENKFKEVAEAYEVLHSSQKRAEYDELRQARSRGTGRASNFSGSSASDQEFADFFNSVFGGAGSGFERGFRYEHAEPFARRGQDLELELPIFLEETLQETSKPVEYMLPQRDARGQRRDVKKSFNVKVPAGVSDGERIRLKGQGAPGVGDAPSGDLYLHIRLVPHPLFDIEGHNLLLTVPLAPWEAALGSKITLPTLSGKIQLTIQPNSQSGQRLRIKGKGLKGKHGIGDLLAVLNVVMPPVASEAAKPLWEQLAKTASFDPRAEWSKQL